MSKNKTAILLKIIWGIMAYFCLAEVSFSSALNIEDTQQTLQPADTAGRQDDIGLTEDEIRWLSQNKTVRFVADPTSAPIEFIDPNGQLSGYAGDYLKLISQRLDIEFVWIENDTLSEGITKIKQGEADVMAAVTESPERLEYLNFSDSYLATSTVIFANKANTHFINIESLSGFLLAQVENFTVTELLKRDYPNLDIITVDSMEEALQMVNDGKADAYVGTIISSSAIISSNNLLQVGMVGDTPYQSLIRIATRKELPLLSSAINKALNSITAVEKAEISNKWSAVQVQVQEVQNYDLLWRIIALSVFILFLTLLWIKKLRKEILLRKMAEQRAEEALAIAHKETEAKTIFLANMSHEIRTPLNAIIGFSDLMASGTFGEIKNPKYQEYLKDIKDSGTHLEAVINDILDLSKIEAGKWTLNEDIFSINDCISSAIKMTINNAKKKNIELLYPYSVEYLDTKIYGDVHCIKRVLLNLLSNSLKFTKAGGKIIITLSLSDTNDLLIKVEDTGIGIPKDRLENVINPFNQAHGDQHLNEEGTGLGLSIVNSLIDLHGGKFILESEIDKGTIVTIIIPSERVRHTVRASKNNKTQNDAQVIEATS